jgi:PilZ domain
MDCGRKHPRNKLNLSCRLIGRDGEVYTSQLVDISFSGALIHAEAETYFKVGDLCDMVLILNSEERPTKRTCEIVRFDNDNIGVKYFTQHYPPLT